MNQDSVPLFPLQTVLFPEGPLPLRIFEPRYLDMISRCMKSGEAFGVVLIAEGGEAGAKVSTHAQGTLAKITDWYQGDDGLLGITACGGDRFRLLSMERQEDGLNLGKIEKLPPEPMMPVPADFRRLASLLRAILSDGEIAELYKGVEQRYDDATWVGYRFAEILPIDLEQKQLCLEMDDPLERLEYLRPMLSQTKQSLA